MHDILYFIINDEKNFIYYIKIMKIILIIYKYNNN